MINSRREQQCGPPAFYFAEAKGPLRLKGAISALDDPAHYDLFPVAAAGGGAHQLTHEHGLEGDIHWMPAVTRN
jgi:hypothetical protein